VLLNGLGDEGVVPEDGGPELGNTLDLLLGLGLLGGVLAFLASLATLALASLGLLNFFFLLLFRKRKGEFACLRQSKIIIKTKRNETKPKTNKQSTDLLGLLTLPVGLLSGGLGLAGDNVDPLVFGKGEKR